MYPLIFGKLSYQKNSVRMQKIIGEKQQLVASAPSNFTTEVMLQQEKREQKELTGARKSNVVVVFITCV